jgi:hypothetical protein
VGELASTTGVAGNKKAKVHWSGRGESWKASVTTLIPNKYHSQVSQVSSVQVQ